MQSPSDMHTYAQPHANTESASVTLRKGQSHEGVVLSRLIGMCHKSFSSVGVCDSFCPPSSCLVLWKCAVKTGLFPSLATFTLFHFFLNIKMLCYNRRGNTLKRNKLMCCEKLILTAHAMRGYTGFLLQCPDLALGLKSAELS